MPRNSEPEYKSPLTVWLERGIVGSLFIIVLFAPHSIAGTQIGWGLGMLFWVVRLTIYPRPKLIKTPIDYALLGFFVISGISCLFSYSPMTSFGKMRAASLFTIVYLFAQ